MRWFLLSLKEAFLLPAITRGREFSAFSPESCVVLSKNAFLEGLFGSLSAAPCFIFPIVLVGRKKSRRAVKPRCLARSLRTDYRLIKIFDRNQDWGFTFLAFMSIVFFSPCFFLPYFFLPGKHRQHHRKFRKQPRSTVHLQSAAVPGNGFFNNSQP